MEEAYNQIQIYIQKRYIAPPEMCPCGNTKIYLNKFNRNKIHPYCFRCTKKECRKIFPLLKSSFFDEFSSKPLAVLIDIFRCFMDYKFNIQEAMNFLRKTKHQEISEKFIRNFYNKMRKYIYLYYILEYATENMRTEIANKFYSSDESLFSHYIKRNSLFLLGIIDNSTKNFRLNLAKDRDSRTIETFILKAIPNGII